MTDHRDSTFRSYQPLEAQHYANTRISYPLGLYNHILEYHACTTQDSALRAAKSDSTTVINPFGLLLDVGCGPGNATRDLAKAFDHAVGIDPGIEMVRAAQKLGGATRTGEQIRFEVCSAEECASASGIQEGEVDLLIAAMAAHWFDMPTFWQQAARAVKPGGTVAIWTLSPSFAHPSTPNAVEVNRIIKAFEEVLRPYERPGNRLVANYYDDLELPWAADPNQTAFPSEDFRRHEWDRGGILNGAEFFGDPPPITLQWLEKGLETVSMVSRWRKVHSEDAGTSEDPVRTAIDALRPLLGDAPFKFYGGTIVLFFKRA